MSASATSAAPSSERDLDDALALLSEKATEFARLGAAAKAELLRACLDRLADGAPAWVAEASRAKALGPEARGEDWLSGPLPTIRTGRLLADSLDAVAADGRPPLGSGSRRGPGGRLEIDVFPVGALDKLVFAGFSSRVLMREGLTREAAIEEQAAFYRQSDPVGGVSLILGAGNVSSIPPLDVFTAMFVEGRVALLKMNPVNEWLGPHLERALEPLIGRGYLRIVYGGAEVGRYLLDQKGVDHVHITGSDRTHDLIVWGPPGPERDRRKAAGQPLLAIPITSELGNVSPVAIVPFEYTDEELAFQARSVVSMVTNNASFNCNAAKMLITSREWRQRETFLQLVEMNFAKVPSRAAYYPGAHERYETLVGGREDIRRFGSGESGRLPWTLIRSVDSADGDDPLFSTEPFCSILSETCVGSADPVEFLASATHFMNETLWGTLNATWVVHPKLERDAVVGGALDDAIVRLRYGTVSVNHWPALGYGFGSPPWGGHPSASLKDIQSGLGWVHNTFMLGGIDKTVVRGSLKAWPTPIWFYDFEGLERIGPKLIAMERAPSVRRLPGLIWDSIRG